MVDLFPHIDIQFELKVLFWKFKILFASKIFQGAWIKHSQYSKPVLSGYSKKDPKYIFNTEYRLRR